VVPLYRPLSIASSARAAGNYQNAGSKRQSGKARENSPLFMRPLIMWIGLHPTFLCPALTMLAAIFLPGETRH
jgi:hypothetical protein